MDDHARRVGWTCAAHDAFHARRDDHFTAPVGADHATGDCAGTPSQHRREREIVFHAGMDRPHPITSRRALHRGVFRAHAVADDSRRSSSTKRTVDLAALIRNVLRNGDEYLAR